MNIISGEVKTTYDLSGEPNSLALDVDGALLFAALDQSQLARIDVQSGNISYVSLPSPASDVAVLDDGLVFAYAFGPPGGDVLKEQYVILDRAGKILSSTKVAPLDWVAGIPLVEWSPVLKRLYFTDVGNTGAKLVRAKIDPNSLQVSVDQRIEHAYSEAYDLRVSPDGKHLAHAMADDLSLPDVDPQDITKQLGKWNTYYGTGFDFSPNSKLLAVTQRAQHQTDPTYAFELAIYDANTRQPIAGLELFSPSHLHKPRFSKGGRLVYSFDGGFSDTHSTVRWLSLP